MASSRAVMWIPRRMLARAVARCLGVALLTLATARAGAQESNSNAPQPELRLDALDVRGVHRGTVQLGLGIEVPLGYYARLGLVGAAGPSSDGARTVGSERADAILRFLLDPFDESLLGLSLGGGVSVQHSRDAGWREYLAVVLDLELPRVRGIIPAVQLGLGGGLRVGLALRPHEVGRR